MDCSSFVVPFLPLPATLTEGRGKGNGSTLERPVESPMWRPVGNAIENPLSDSEEQCLQDHQLI